MFDSPVPFDLSVVASAVFDSPSFLSICPWLLQLRGLDDRKHTLQFRCTHDPVDFVRMSVAASAARRVVEVGHLVLAPISEISDFAVSARIAAVLLGSYYADPRDFVAKGKLCGCQYIPQLTNSKSTYYMAVSPAINATFPSVAPLLTSLARIPGSSLELHSVRNLEKRYLKTIKHKPRIGQQMCVLATEEERDAAPLETRPIYLLRVGFLPKI